MQGTDSPRALGSVVFAGAAAGVVAYVNQQLNKESATMDHFFSTYNTPQSEASRQRVFDGAVEDPRTNLLNVLSHRR